MIRLMRKPTICTCENKDADQLRGNRETDQRLCFRYSDSTIPLLLTAKISSCDCTGRFMSDLFGNHIVGFPTRRLKYLVILLFMRVLTVCVFCAILSFPLDVSVELLKSIVQSLTFFLLLSLSHNLRLHSHSSEVILA